MPSKSTKSVKIAAKPVKKSVKSSTSRSTTTKKAGGLSRVFRMNFVAGVAVGAAALVAIAMGISTYNKAPSMADTAGLGSLYLTKQTPETVKAGSTVTVDLYANSGNQPVNAVQSAIRYPADKLEFVSVKTADTFPQEAATDTATPGLIRIARSVGAGAAAVSGKKPIATLEFKVLSTTGSTTSIGIDLGQSLLVRSTDNKNIL